MTNTSKLTTWGLLATLAATTLTPVFANPASQQKNKNNWRNLGIAGAVVAGYGLLKGNQTATILGAAGGAYAANRYETDRRHQSQDSRYNNYDNYSNGNRRYHRNYGWQPPVTTNHDYQGNNDYQGNSGSDNRNQYSQNDQGRQWANERHDNGRHLGWTKHHGGDGERD